jgi:hypothetical protein
MGDKADVWQGTLALMVLRTLDTMGPLHGYGIARRVVAQALLPVPTAASLEQAQARAPVLLD